MDFLERFTASDWRKKTCIFDTAVGVIVALLVNYFLPRERVAACWEKVKGLFRPLEHS